MIKHQKIFSNRDWRVLNKYNLTKKYNGKAKPTHLNGGLRFSQFNFF